MTLKLYNSLTRRTEPLSPKKEGEVSVYVCGITPYGTTHLGHAFTYVSFDVLIRYLKFLGYKVNYVQNVTDIDDDILKKAKEENRDWRELGQYWTDRFLSDMKALNWIVPMHYVKATDSIPTIIKIVSDLLKKGFAYEKEGDIYFEMKKFKEYGKLGKFGREEMIRLSRERGADPQDPKKRDPLDFILWQSSKPGEPFWESPFGPPAGGGRPGWHIECSGMIHQYLGERIDIHGGGKDLIFPHHESEIAQSESFTGKKPFARFFLHTAMVLYEGEKMAKSLGNLVMVQNLLRKGSGNTIRFMLLSHHYRRPWEFEDLEVSDCQEDIDLINEALEIKSKSGKKTSSKKYFNDFILHMNDDLDTPHALNAILRLSSRITKEKNKDVSGLQGTLKKALRILGFKFTNGLL